MKTAFSIYLGVFLLCGSAGGSDDAEREIRDLYRRGLAGNKPAVEECIAKLEAVLKTRLNDELARVYLGSAYTLRSRDLGFGPKKLQALKQGLGLMDAAIAAAPNDPKIRLARALTTSALPGIFARRPQSRQDFELLAKEAERAPERFEQADLTAIREHASAVSR